MAAHPPMPDRVRRTLVAGARVVAMLSSMAVGAADPDAPPAPAAGWHEEVVFDRYSPLAAKWEFARRTFAPTTYDRLRRFEQASGVEVADHTVDLREERFDLFVPEHRPASGYGLIVFVSPMSDFPLPRDWKRELDARGIVFVSARRSGNEQNAYERRMPLALHAYGNVAARLPIDPDRVYVAGFSGGARIAQRLALGYPEVFRGAILFGSSDPFGEPGIRGEPPLAPPLREFMDPFRAHTRVALVTGAQDLPNRVRDARTADSLREFCTRHVAQISIARLGHWVPDRRGLARALRAVEPADAGAVPEVAADCDTRLQRRIDDLLEQVVAELDAGDARAAGVSLGQVEERYGGLAAPRSVELSRRISETLDTGRAK